MIPKYKNINELKDIKTDIDIRYLFEDIQLKNFFISNPEIFNDSSKQIFLRIHTSNKEESSISFIIFSKDYMNVLYETSILISKVSHKKSLQSVHLKNTMVTDYLKDIRKILPYKNKYSIKRNVNFRNIFISELDLSYFLKQRGLSINDVTILTKTKNQLIEIRDKQDSYLIFKNRYQTWR